MVLVRREHPEDVAGIRVVNERAFGRPDEANLVDTLRRTCPAALSLVAVLRNRVVGHVLFSPATIEGPDGIVRGMGLAPVAVLPEHQRQGIGSKLIRSGLEILKAASCPFVIVLGHAQYYPRFGFERASAYGIRSQWDEVPEEAFMILMLDEAMRSGVSGVARYRSEFDAAM